MKYRDNGINPLFDKFKSEIGSFAEAIAKGPRLEPPSVGADRAFLERLLAYDSEAVKVGLWMLVNAAEDGVVVFTRDGLAAALRMAKPTVARCIADLSSGDYFRATLPVIGMIQGSRGGVHTKYIARLIVY